MKQYSRFSVITNSKFILCALLLSQTLLGCAALGTKTLYKTESEYKIQITTLGFVKPHLGSFAVMKFPETSELMTNTFIQYMNESGDYNFKVVEDSSQIDFFLPGCRND